jgi:hypothetical protein
MITYSVFRQQQCHKADVDIKLEAEEQTSITVIFNTRFNPLLPDYQLYAMCIHEV